MLNISAFLRQTPIDNNVSNFKHFLMMGVSHELLYQHSYGDSCDFVTLFYQVCYYCFKKLNNWVGGLASFSVTACMK